MKILCKALFSSRNYHAERATKGFKSFVVPQKPPRSAVVQLQYENGDHLGYANCIRLFSGENALVTAEHCVEGAWAHSKKTGNRLPLSTFTPLHVSKSLDFALLVGPPNWEGLLGVKGAHFVTADKLGRGNASFFALDDGEWVMSSAQVDGTMGKFATVLCNTEDGHSGTGMWSGKSLLGIHLGHPKDDNLNFNLMAPIIPIPGLTEPMYVFESSKPQGRVFSEELIDEMVREFIRTDPIINFKSITGKNWADYEEEKAEPSKGKEPVTEAPTTQPLNTDAAAPAKTTATSNTPAEGITEPRKMMEQIIEAMVKRINLESLEQKIIAQVAGSALKRAPMRRRRGKRGGRSNQKTSPPTSTQPTTGTKDKVTSPASARAAEPHNITPPGLSLRPNGGKGYAPSSQNWRQKPLASAGPKPAQRQNA